MRAVAGRAVVSVTAGLTAVSIPGILVAVYIKRIVSNSPLILRNGGIITICVVFKCHRCCACAVTAVWCNGKLVVFVYCIGARYSADFAGTVIVEFCIYIVTSATPVSYNILFRLC